MDNKNNNSIYWALTMCQALHKRLICTIVHFIGNSCYYYHPHPQENRAYKSSVNFPRIPTQETADPASETRSSSSRESSSYPLIKGKRTQKSLSTLVGYYGICLFFLSQRKVGLWFLETWVFSCPCFQKSLDIKMMKLSSSKNWKK